MEPHQTDKPVESRGESPSVPPRPPQRQRRFQIIKLEERIAPGGPHTTYYCNGNPSGNGKGCLK
jgi:hypothetical protein